MKKILLVVPIFAAFYCGAQPNYAAMVNPFVGTGGHGHTYPGAALPFGMVQLSPDTRLTGWDACGGYHYSDNVIYGFSHTHLSGTGVEDYCDILLQPTTGELEWNNEKYKSKFSHKSEQAQAGYYKVNLEKYDIDVELSATLRTGVHQYTFPKSAKTGNVLIDLEHKDIVINSSLKKVDDYTMIGMRQSKSWAQNQILYFAIKFSRPIKEILVSNNSKLNRLEDNAGKSIKAYTTFNLSGDRKLVVQVALSAVSEAGALKNLAAETVNTEFNKAKTNAEIAWNKELGKIQVEEGTKEQQIIFYTALYHTLLNPNTYQDVDGQFRGTDQLVHTVNDYTNYTVFSLWDTYRALHPLMTIINRAKTLDWIKTFLKQDEYGGMLPVWELSANETFCMIGYHSVSVITDAYMKGIKGFDTRAALNAMIRYSESRRFGLPYYIKLGYLPNDFESESVSKTLEYAYDDWCIAQLAKEIGDVDTYNRFIIRALSYKNVFDQKEKFMRGKIGAMWHSPFDPKEINNFFTEANSWQYSFSVPQDVKGLIKLYGGKNEFEQKLDALFSADTKTTGRDQSDVTGLIGQYAHGNEPSHHIAFLYQYIGKPDKTQDRVNQILANFYTNQPDGLIGNEDCGQMSAWYVMAALGLYDVCPGAGNFNLMAPLFPKITINLENGKKWVIEAKKASRNSKYVNKVLLNNQPYSLTYLSANTLNEGGKIVYELGDTPNDWGTGDFAVPYSEITQASVIVPNFEVDSKKFKDEKLVKITTTEVGGKLFYAFGKTNKIDPKRFEYLEYTEPIKITESTKIYAYCKNNKVSSPFIHQQFYKIPNNKSIIVQSEVNSMYTAGGPDALIDSIIGEENYKTGEWQSYEGNDFEAIIDLKSNRPVEYVGIHVLQDVGSWIWLPKYVQYYSSSDGKVFTDIGRAEHQVSDKDYKASHQVLGINTKMTTRYIKIVAKNYGTVPDWHPGKGGKSHIFIDEVIVK